jgi:serine/threonine-protein kinase
VSSVREHQVDTLLHRGATCEVWRATRLGPNGFAVPVALKTLNESAAAASEQVSSFLREARAASSVQHRNVVQVRELILDRNRYWLSMELVPGWPVRALLSAIDACRQRIPIPVALSLARDAIRGVQAIHDAGLVHRNVAPDNLMVDPTGQLVVLDFGVATWQHAQRIRYTPPVDVLDPVYASPDLRARLPVDARTDVFSLGALLEELIPKDADAPVALEAIIRRALDPDPARRFPSAQALEIALDLLAIREGWLVPQSYVSAYVNDVLRSAAPAMQRVAPGSNASDTDVMTPPLERQLPPPAATAVLPRGRRGMVGVGALLASARGEPELVVRDAVRGDAPHVVHRHDLPQHVVPRHEVSRHEVSRHEVSRHEVSRQDGSLDDALHGAIEPLTVTQIRVIR